jgi:hypothetical protein
LSPADEHTGTPPGVDFTAFLLSLSQTALQQLGCTGGPEKALAEPNLVLAQYTIDLLAMLQEKTRGNLTTIEEKLLSSILYDLRMRFVECARAPHP